MDAAALSSSSAALPPKKYDVFISFRGEDTRTNFTSHLYEALRQKNVETYIDDRLDKGDEISQALIQAIHDSSVSVVVFSENYASSKWCLDELTQILQCKKEEGQKVIPIFYKVDPSDVRKQNGSYKEAFAKHEKDFMHNQDTVNMWGDALFQAANLSGWDSRIYKNEYVLIQNIVNDVLKKLDPMHPSSASKGLVGIDENYKCIESLLRKARVIGIWGMGGIGKTTMAKVVYTELCRHYESYCFLENVREEFEKHGLNYIRDKVVKQLLKKNLEFMLAKRKLSRKKVLIVLDDVSNSKQLDDLEIEWDSLGPGSRVIITARNKHVLIGRVDKIHEARALKHDESLKLFSIKAFHKDHPEIGYERLSKRVVAYAKGLPLVLTVLGSFLYSKTIREWDSALKKLGKTPNEDIQKVLKLSYDELNDEEREMFLDIACFFKDQGKEEVIRQLESLGFHARIGIRSLLDKALIVIDSKVRIHDLIQKMGYEIVRQECIKEPGRRSRLWDCKDVYDVLKNNKGTDAVQGILLNKHQIRDVCLRADTFNKMPNLRFLKVYSPPHLQSSDVSLPFGLESFSDRIRYFHWDRYPLESLPSSFCAENLVEIHMLYSGVKKLWDGVQDVANLKILNLYGSALVELPDFSKAQSLELVNLSLSPNLRYVHPSILSLDTLASLLLNGCSKLKRLHSKRHLKSLKELEVLQCTSLKEFSLSSEKITHLDLLETRIEILHSSFGRSSELRCLFLNGSSLKKLPIKGICFLTSLEKLRLSFCRLVIDKPILHILFNALRSLRELRLEACSNMVEVPDNISCLSSLEELSLNESSIESLPSSIKHLSKLEFIHLKECRRLRSLPQLSPFLRHLDATGCTSLETAFTLSTNYRMEFVSLKNCGKMDEHSLWGIMVDAYFSLMRRAYISPYCQQEFLFEEGVFCYPGSKVPGWFGYNRTTWSSLTIELVPPLDNLMGFILCAVIPQINRRLYPVGLLKCQIFLEDGGKVRIPMKTTSINGRLFNLEHVLLWNDTSPVENLLQEIKRRQNEQGTACNPKVSFEFRIDSPRDCCTSAPKYHNSVLERNLHFKKWMKTRRHLGINEEKQLLPEMKLGPPIGTIDQNSLKFERNFCDWLIKEYGVYPVYALEHHNLVEEVNLHFKEKKCTKTKRYLGVNEEAQLPPEEKLNPSIDIIDNKIEELILSTIGIEYGD